MKRLNAVMASCVLILGACGSERAPTPPRKSNSRVLEVSTDRDSATKDADAERNSDNDLLSADADIEIEPVEIGGEGDTAQQQGDAPAAENVTQDNAKEKDDNKETEAAPPSPPATTPTLALTVTTVKKRKKNVRAFVQSGKSAQRELLWPNDEDATAANESLCLKGQVTEVSFKIFSQDKGDLLPGSEEVGILKVSPDTIEIGYEEDGCDEELCQNDNIVRLHCADGIKLMKPF